MYSQTSHNIRVTVLVDYLPNESRPQEGLHAWSYQVEIENLQDYAVQLLRRHWTITDMNGITKEVKGPGVVGQQPVIEAGERFDYTSGTWLNTTSGMMFGTYTMLDIDGNEFDVTIPAFSLDVPGAKLRAN
ncbi:MAG: Co2+/Mg2+ efflux protein ApaG [Alphaproteobacteria bacterium]|nr:Co2+/Mg2+ efflux protein ApaG [Alphaproteobacteria bacterium]